jgi:carboxylate-amine ligase
VSSLEEGVGVLDRIGPWLPALRALGANSPFWHGEDTGYASYRTTIWDRWPSAGPTGPFGSLAAYDETVAAMLDTGALLDDGMVYFDARLSRALSTVELRVSDVCLSVDDAVLVAALARALVTTAARSWAAGEPVRATRQEVLSLAHWRAARSGLADALVNPVSGRPAPAAAVLRALRTHVADALTDAGDADLVEDDCARVLADGTGSAVQRALAAAHGGDLHAVVTAAVARTDPDGDPPAR